MLSDEAKQIADLAKSKGMWLYCPLYKKWYSPEEFKHIFTYANAKPDFLKQVQIKHPSEGVNAGFKIMSALQTKLQNFAKSVLDYYKK